MMTPEHSSQQAICPQSRNIIFFGRSMQMIQSLLPSLREGLVGRTGAGGAVG
jgi:hypothetical protein